MRTIYEDVKTFHKAMGAPIILSPRWPAKERIELRVNLNKEEWKETRSAAEAGDLVKVADGIGDCIYVLTGTAIEFGVDLLESATHPFPFSGTPSFPNRRTLETRIDVVDKAIDEVNAALTSESVASEGEKLNEVRSAVSVAIHCLVIMAQEFSIDLPGVWALIQRTNMSKIVHPHTAACSISRTGKCDCGAIIYRKEDGKILKPPGFMPCDPDIANFLINCGADPSKINAAG